MGKCECGRLKGNPCGPLRPNTINVTMPLVALYNATDGANWTNYTNWLTNEAISEWRGVVTDGEGRN